MSVNASTTIKAPVDTVLKTFVDEAFVRHVSDRAGTELESFEVNGDTSTAFTATTVRSMGADKLPDVVQKFVKGGVKSEEPHAESTSSALSAVTASSGRVAERVPLGVGDVVIMATVSYFSARNAARITCAR